MVLSDYLNQHEECWYAEHTTSAVSQQIDSSFCTFTEWVAENKGRP